jgi:hypothetical protein
MVARRSLAWTRGSTFAAALVCAASSAEAGHEVPYYPSFYPQEIRIEPLDPQAAAREFANVRDPLHAYIGAAPQFSGAAPAGLKSVLSLHSFVVAGTDRQSPRMQSREARCRAVGMAAPALAAQPDLIPHRYPVTPYHADYIGHIDRAAGAKPNADAKGAAATGTSSDVSFDEVPLDRLLREAGFGTAGIFMTPPWAKEGWFQAYHLLRRALRDAEEGKRADAIYERLTDGNIAGSVERINLQRDLVAALTRDCDRAVVGYRLRREFHSDDFSNGVENIAVDSQTGLNSPVAVRTMKLKDLPWNGWLRVGIDGRAGAAWNPVAGFTDSVGRLVWATVGDDAFLSIPYNSQFVQNRAEILNGKEKPAARQSIRIPADAMTVDAAGRLAPAGESRGAMAKVTYRISASAFHDGTAMEAADYFYPYALALRWGGSAPGGAAHDPEVAGGTRLLRERFKAVRVARVEETKLPIADLVFEYRWPVVEVFLDSISSDEQENALIAPPWSAVPWHVLALMEAAVERGIAAFSQTEAARLNRPWLDLVRDGAQRDALRALIREFVQSGYRPAAIEALVTADQAKARWAALDRFAEANGHLLVTNGPYKLRSFTPAVVTFDVIREFTYPMGLGTFDFHAHPAKAHITRTERAGNRILLTADAEIAVKQQRDRVITRAPLARDTMRGTLAIRPLARYVVVGPDGRVAAAGLSSRGPDGRFVGELPALAPGEYSYFGAILLDGNAVDPSVGRIEFRVN